MYKVIPWDYPDEISVFDTYLDALQYGNINYGSRYYLVEKDKEESKWREQ